MHGAAWKRVFGEPTRRTFCRKQKIATRPASLPSVDALLVTRRDLSRRVLTWALGTLCWHGVASAAGDGRAAKQATGNPPASTTAPELLPASVDERVQLYGVALGYGAASGYWIRELAGSTHWSAWVLPGAGTAAVAVGAVAWLDAQDAWTYGQPQAIVTDTLVGTGIAALWVWHDRERNPPDGTWSPAVQATLLWSGATLGAAAGWLRYHLSPSPPGQAALTGSTALWSGALSGLTAGALTAKDDTRARNLSLAAALGMEGGVILGSWLGRALRPAGGWSIGWVRTVDAGALLGAVAAGGTTALLTGKDLDSRPTLGAAAAGLAAGGLTAAWLAPALGWPRGGNLRVVPEASATGLGLKLTGDFH